MVQVTSREFRANQATLLDKADQGEQVVIRRKGKRSYLLTPIYDSDMTITPELEMRIGEAREQYKRGETISFPNANEAAKFLDTL